MSFSLKILGSSSAIPAYDRNHTAQILHIYNSLYLIDCGEGTQIQLKKYKVNFNKIVAIFISHLHGDHFFGLSPLISTMSLLGRDAPLKIHGPKGLAEIITIQLKYSESILNFPIEFIETNADNSPEVIYDENNLTVTTLPLEHRIACTGFLFREKSKPRRINPDIIGDFSNSQLKALKEGKDILASDGSIQVRNEEATLAPRKCRSYAFCSDTRYNEKLIPFLQNVDLLYHESTFLEKHADRAAVTFHTTAKQAASIAKQANVEKLLLGHFSTRYPKLDYFIEEASPIFANVALATEGSTFEVEH